MVAHGYGLAAIGSPNLIFSNVLWGHAVRFIPEIAGTQGYSLATIAVLAIVGTVVGYGMLRLHWGVIGAAATVILILARPVLFPQFTISAGLLMISAVICVRLFTSSRNGHLLWIGCLLAFFSYLVRSHEALLIFLIALPLLPWRAIQANHMAKIATGTLVAAIAVAALIDHQAYLGSDWNEFNSLNYARALYTDFGVGSLLKQRVDILTQHQYSINDIDLISNWFFADRNIADPAKLNAMVYELASLPKTATSIDNAWLGVKALWHPNLMPLFSGALLLALLRPSWRVMAVWGLAVAAVFSLGLLGRPGTLRVYVPVVCLLVIAPLLINEAGLHVQGVWRKRITAAVVLSAAVFNLSVVIPESQLAEASSRSIRNALQDFPSEPVLIWGGTFPFESIYPVINPPAAAMHYQLYGLGVFTLAPFSTAVHEVKSGRGMLTMLFDEKGFPAIIHQAHLDMLDVYCRERDAGKLIVESTRQYGVLKITNVRCKKEK